MLYGIEVFKDLPTLIRYRTATSLDPTRTAKALVLSFLYALLKVIPDLLLYSLLRLQCQAF